MLLTNTVLRDDKQLAGYATKGQESNCPNDTETLPCGFVANSMFSDTISAISNVEEKYLSKEEIAFPNEDRAYTVKNNWNEDSGGEPKAWKGTDLHKNYFSQEQSDRQDFKVWMRSAPLPHFRKLWYKVSEEVILKDEVEIEIKDKWPPVKTPNLKKKVIITQANFMGGKSMNKFLISFGMSLFFFVSSMLLFHMSRQDKK